MGILFFCKIFSFCPNLLIVFPVKTESSYCSNFIMCTRARKNGIHDGHTIGTVVGRLRAVASHPHTHGQTPSRVVALRSVLDFCCSPILCTFDSCIQRCHLCFAVLQMCSDLPPDPFGFVFSFRTFVENNFNLLGSFSGSGFCIKRCHASFVFALVRPTPPLPNKVDEIICGGRSRRDGIFFSSTAGPQQMLSNIV